MFAFADLNRRHKEEVDPVTALALRLLYAAAAGEDEDYAAFLLRFPRLHPKLLDALKPLHVLQLMCIATADAHAASTEEARMRAVLAVWYFDEITALEAPSSAELVSFMQQLLSAAVQLRVAALQQMQCGNLNVLPVFLTGSTLGTASSLQHTSSKQSKVKDLRLALVTNEQKCLMVMDLVRRLPLPEQLRKDLKLPSREGALADLNQEQQRQLLAVCPHELSYVLTWLGGFLRLTEHAVACLSGIKHKGSARNLGISK